MGNKMIRVVFGDRKDISSPGLDGKRWRYSATLKREMPAPKKSIEELIKIDVLLVGSYGDGLDYDESDLEMMVFALVMGKFESNLRAGTPPTEFGFVINEDMKIEFESIDPRRVPPPGKRRYEFELEEK